jgi:predicted unusual protein kinase regulating ubiquinone biosynthesis (AarF/ABC1/UbiB family)
MTTNVEESNEVIDRARYRKILIFFAGVIANIVWWDLLVGRLFKGPVRRGRPERFRRMSRRFRQVAIEMGGVMIKLGQFLSARVDVLPPEITEELAGLQDEVPPVPFEEIESVLAAELGDVNAHFSHFWASPLAAASLGQAHKARLVPSEANGDGHDTKAVVVKVQRPDIEDIVRTDLAALRVVSRWVMRYKPIRRRANVPALIEEFSSTMWEELDYISEADNAERFAEMFADDPGVRIPGVYRQHSTRRVLVLEDVSAIKITDIEEITAAGVDRGQVAVRLLDAYFYQIFKKGFFHADPHPGNLFIQPVRPSPGDANGSTNPFVLTFVDFGMVGHVEELMGQNLRQVLVAVSQKDARALTEAYNDLGFFLPGSDLDRIAEAQEQILDQIWGRSITELSQPDPEEVREFSQEFRDIMFEFPFQVPQDFIFLGRALGMLSGLSTLLDPDINPWLLVEKYGRDVIRSREGLEFGLATLIEWAQIFIAMPSRIDRLLTAAETGRLRVQMTHDRTLLRRLDRIERQLSRPNWSLLAAVFLLCGTLFYVNGEVALSVVFWIFAGVFLLLTFFRRD